ncbi:MAG: hypothetical protein KIT84_04475 [Labilithrix sp.]|nr:hypothetical protein [Labilithrix sp.]MCW5810241.1 hypothetical protein [Labilithrix sp.]
MLPVRALAGGLLVALVAGCAADGAGDDDDAIASDDAALSALEAEIGFDGAIERLDEAALEAIDRDARALEAEGVATSSIESLTTKKTLHAALRRGPVVKAGVKTKALRTLDVYDSDLFKLNELEKTLCRSHRIVCVRVALAAFKARGASQAAYRDGNVGGRIDAFRHTYWNAAMTRSVGEDHAKAWGDAHENGYPQNRATPKDRVLSDMDFFNNAVGREIGREHANSSDGKTKQAVRDAIANGDVRAVRYDLGDRDGTLVPSSQCSDTVKCGT